jgi:lysophospholipase L1-like esterase
MKCAKVIATGIISALVFLTLILLIETSVRWFYPEIPPQHSDRRLFDPHKYGRTYGYKALATGEELGTLTITDEHGFRINPRSLQRNFPEQVLVLGDSVSVGIGVEAEQTYPALLEEKLGKKVLNASVTGYGIMDYVEVLGRLANRFNPRVVLVGICLNDVSAASQVNLAAMARNSKEDRELSPDERRYPNIVMRTLRYINDNYLNFHTFLGSYSRTYVFVKSLAADSARDHFSADRSYYQRPQTIEYFRSHFTELKRALADDTALVVVVFPYEYQLRTGSLKDVEPQDIIREAARRAGVPIYDLYDELMEYLKVNRLLSGAMYLFNDPLHFNSVGHHAIAELLYRRIQSEHRLESSRHRMATGRAHDNVPQRKIVRSLLTSFRE